MLTRLTFAISTFTPEILLLDEWIMVAMLRSFLKAQRRLESFIEKTSIVVLASTTAVSVAAGAPRRMAGTREKLPGGRRRILDAYAGKTRG